MNRKYEKASKTCKWFLLYLCWCVIGNDIKYISYYSDQSKKSGGK